MKDVKITISAEREVLTLEFNQNLDISEFYDKLELIALFVGYHKNTIDNELNREVK